MLGKFFDKILHEDEGEEERKRKKKKYKTSPPRLLVVLVVFFLALVPRLVYLFFFTDSQNIGIDWYGDVYHHWQIAWLSKEIGFEQGFLRLWDFKGLEFYWGLLHPLLLSILFGITSSVSIVIPRVVSAVFGAGSIVLIFMIVHRHFGHLAAWGSAVFSTFLPVTLFSETLGMQEPLGLFFLLLGIYLVGQKPLFAGFSWVLAGMVRSEFWVFGAALMLIVLIRGRMHFDKKVAVLVGFGFLSLLYMKYMLDYTGSAFYPIKVAYLATYKGEWFLADVPTEKEIFIQNVSRIIFFVSSSLGLFVIWRRPKAYLFFLLGLGNIAFVGLIHGFGARILGWVDNTLVDRMLSFPYEFLGVALSIFLLYWLPKLWRHLRYGNVVILLIILIAVQPSWFIIEEYHARAMHPSWENDLALAHAVARNWPGQGSIIIPSGRPGMTYALAYFEKMPAKALVSDFYSPFYYAQDDPFSDWEKFREEIIEWIKKFDVKILVYTGRPDVLSEDNLGKMLAIEEGRLFKPKSEAAGSRIYEISLNEE